MSFKNAIKNNTAKNENTATTANGAKTLKSSLNPLVDLFFMIGSLRNKDISDYSKYFDKAFASNPLLTMQMLLWCRDIRGGAGERKTVRNLLEHMETKYPTELEKLIPYLPEYGRWDDLLIFKTDACKKVAYETIIDALKAGNGLCAKWMPRFYKRKVGKSGNNMVSNKNREANNKIASELCTMMGITPRQYRKMLATMSNTVEQAMCAKKWDSIDYSKLPSIAGSRYRNAFMRNDEHRYREYLDALTKGETKVNAATLYPYDVIRAMVCDNYSYSSRIKLRSPNEVQLAIAQWDALPNFLGDNKILPMVDTSGSMNCRVSMDSSMTVMDVAVSLGLYVSTKQTGVFKDTWLNFSDTPKLKVLPDGDISVKLLDLYNKHGSDWGNSTNITAAFEKILSVAKTNNVPPEDMPKMLLIFSDMEFNPSKNKTAHEYMCAKFKAAGYEVPVAVFWNLNARGNNNPVRFDTNKTALISGFSPNIIKPLLSGESVNPISIMLAAIDDPRYRVFG